MCSFDDLNMRKLTYDEVRQAMKGKSYQMSLVGDDAKIVERAVNQGIDSHLEACFVPDRGDRFERTQRKTKDGRVHTVALNCEVSVESMPVLLRRLFEFNGADEEYDRASHLAQGILDSIIGEED